MTKLVLALVVLAAVLPVSSLAAGARHTRAALPQKAVLVPGKSLAGVRLGDSEQRVLSLWGADYTTCDFCRLDTWLYTYEAPNAVGAAVSFLKGRVVAVFTLGTPIGWRSTDGLKLGEFADRIDAVHPDLPWKSCIGYVARSFKSPNGAVTSIYSDGQTIYGFALTHAAQPVCQ